MKLNHSIATIGYFGWCGLGFTRGVNCYKYRHNNTWDKNTPYFYTTSILYGFAGFFMYASPFLLPIFIYKESYRFEINLRNLENEKNSSLYNELL